MSFYVTLISDSSRNFFPDNAISEFITQLPSAIDLNNGEWEVGLVNIIYPHTWYNIRKENNLFGFDLGDGKENGRRVPPGCYENIPDLLKAMTLASHKNKIEFLYHPVTKRVTIKTKDECKVILHEGIAELIGYYPGIYSGTIQSPFISGS